MTPPLLQQRRPPALEKRRGGVKTHLIGAGGIGMSGIAMLLLARGEKVSGSDAADSPLLQRIRQKGAVIQIGHSGANVDGADRVVYSSAITPRNPEFLAARNRNIPVLHRGQMVAHLLAGYRTIAVTGAHGKSTTSAMAAELLVATGWDPTVLLGAEVEALGGNARVGRGRYAVIEADESDSSLLWYRPAVAIITNMDEEHLDYYRNSGEILEMYAAFADRIHPDGLLIGCVDDPMTRRIIAAAHRRRITYGLSKEAQITAKEIQMEPGGSRYRCVLGGKTVGRVRLQVPGVHNVLNSLAIMGLAVSLGIDLRMAQRALEQFRGPKRRFQIQGEIDGILIVEDYGHHPTEIEATLQAARNWPGRRVRCVFQPHRYSRTKYLLDRFVASLSQADEVVLLPIYAASEEPLEGVTSDLLLEQIRAAGRCKSSIRSAEDTLKYLVSESKAGEMILFLGAGNVVGLAARFAQALKEKKVHARSVHA